MQLYREKRVTLKICCECRQRRCVFLAVADSRQLPHTVISHTGYIVSNYVTFVHRLSSLSLLLSSSSCARHRLYLRLTTKIRNFHCMHLHNSIYSLIKHVYISVSNGLMFNFSSHLPHIPSYFNASYITPFDIFIYLYIKYFK